MCDQLQRLSKKLFGKRFGIDEQLTYTIQFIHLTEEQVGGAKPDAAIPERLRAYIGEFDGQLSHDEYNSERYSFRLLFKRKLVNRPGQADKVIEFIAPASDLAKAIDKEYWVKKEVERPKFRPKDVIAELQKLGFTKFRVSPEHVALWKAEDAKNPGKGFGVDVSGSWYWYQSWVDHCIEHCKKAGDRYV